VDSTGNDNSVILRSQSPEQTFQLGAGIGKILKAGDFLALIGELGSGKTAFVQGLARGMGVPAAYAVVSPTFTLINEYPGQSATLYHLDVYRLASSADLLDTGFDEAIFQKGVTVVEWAERIADFIPPYAITVVFAYVVETKREITISVRQESVMHRLKGVVF
jgi:tRNA threonylcarbamoyladenosine biosynthesis protein TsaE